ncbi:MAG: hypothetical protein M0P97_01590 [Candidatus Moranbacteria bacterium]|jgi:hypothetical protein|nr:hypothetical protein [Candidatus Moranbacteria bacterium]
MRTIFRDNKKISILLISAFLVAAGSASAAIDASSSVGSKKDQMQQIKEDRKADIQDRICDRMGELGSKIQERLRMQNENRQQNRSNNEIRLQTRTQEQVNNLEQRRQLRDQKRAESYTNLQAMVQTEQQTVAILEFKASIEEAVKTRRLDTDEAIDAFHKGVQQAIDDRNSSVDGLISEYQKNREQITVEVKNICSTDGDVVGTKQSLQTKLQQAKDDFNASKKDIPNVSEKVRELAQIRKEAVNDASEIFMEKVKTAQEKLRAEFQNKVESVDLGDE